MAAKGVKFYSFVILVFTASSVVGQSFDIDYDKDTFRMNGEPFRYISGSIHYQRVPYQYWNDRLKKMAAAGLNAIQTYVAWNGHEKMPGQYDFSGQQDIETFLQTAHSYNLSVILRPGPYICAEWEFGGFPAWLLKYPTIQLRTMDKNYIAAVDRWLTKLYTVIEPYLFKNGGPIITLQVENEYGSYFACDYNYLTYLKNKAQSMLGNDVVLFTTDGDGDGYLKCGTVSGAYATVDFGITDDPEKNFAIQRHKEPHGPLVNSEYYTGWLDHWGEQHSTVDKQLVANSLDKMLALGANVNMYMFEGGTNFAFWNGAEYSPYKTNPTSYDYDAPLSEAGDITDKYLLIREVISKYRTLPDLHIPPNTPKKAYGKVMLSYVETVKSYVESFPNVTSKYPLTMEKLNHFYGFLMYQHVFTQDEVNGELDLSGVRDRAYVSVGSAHSQVAVGVVERETKNTTVSVSGRQGDVLCILVENQGRINYGSQINNNTKGLIYNVTLNGRILTNWKHFPVQLEEISQLKYHQSYFSYPVFGDSLTLPAIYKGELSIEETPEDTYIDMSKWTKGQIFVNGQNMGRYWPKMGPQVRLYIPKFALKEGSNEIVLLELEKSPCEDKAFCYVDFMDTPLINATRVTEEDRSTKSDSVFELFIRFVVQFWELIIGLF